MRSALFQRGSCRRGEFAEFRDRAARSFALRPGPSRTIVRSFYDTADWRLYRRGQTLEHDEGSSISTRLRDLGDASRFIEQGLETVPRFGREFPDGPLGNAIAPVIGVRALLPLGEFRLKVSPYEVLDDRGKILAYIDRERIEAEGGAAPKNGVSESIRIRPLKGYEKVGRRLAADLDQALSAAPATGDPWYRFLLQRGRRPGDYSTRFQIQLSPDMGARQALARILLFLFDAMQKSVSGMKADQDPEFLHDFRVGCRRSRTLFTQVRGVLPESRLHPFRETWGWLSSATSERRDLDVFLWDFPLYREMLGGDPDGAALEPLQRLLTLRRKQEHERLLGTFGSERYARFTRDWRAFLEATATGPEAVGGDGETVMDCGNRSIRRLLRRLLRRGGEILPGYSEALHELRKTGKKLRYVMEAYGSLYPEEEIRPALKQLRRLQNVMGKIVDYHVQQDIVKNWRAELATRLDPQSPTFAALDRLVEGFGTMEMQAGKNYQECFECFAGTAGRRRMESLLGAQT